MFKLLYSWEKSIWNRYFTLIIFNAVMLQHLIIQFSSIICQVVAHGRLKNKGKFQTFSSKSGRGRLREVVVYKGSKYSDLTWKLLVFWKTGRLREVVATGGSTVFSCRLFQFFFFFDLLIFMITIYSITSICLSC